MESALEAELDALVVDYRGPAALEATSARHHPCSLNVTAHGGLDAGAELRILVFPFRAVLDSICTDQIHLHGVRPSVDVPVEVLRRPPANVDEIVAAFVGRRVSVLELALPEGCSAGCSIEIELGIKPSPHAGIGAELDVEARSNPQSEFRSIGGASIAVVAGPATALECRARRANGAIDVSIFARDLYANVAQSFSGRVHVGGETVDVENGHRVVHIAEPPIPETPRRLEAVDEERSWRALSPPLCARMPFFGDLHFHTDFSGDGGGALADSLAYVRDVLQLDVAAVTDHTPTAFWDETLRIDDAFDEPGRFVTLPSWEWSTRTGHANVYLRTTAVGAGPEREAEESHPSRLTWPRDTIVIPHHTNIDSSYDDPDNDGEVHWHEYDWSVPNPAIRLVEIVQCRGNFEADTVDPDWGIVTGGIGASVQDALDRGYRIGFVGGTDNHSGAPTRDSLVPGAYVGLTGIYANELSRTAIWDALWERRTFATSGVPIVGWTQIAGVDMGGEKRGHDGEVCLDAELHGTAPIERVEVISARRVVWSATPDSLDVELRGVPLPSSAGDAWYYVRLRQRDGHRAWFSPVWLDR